MNSVQYYSSITEINQGQWQTLRQNSYPFLDYEFLSALEKHRCIGESTPWQPLYIAQKNEQDDITHLLPCYIKYDSQGEFVFDRDWAQAYHRYGLSYYPKLINAIPFTPVSGERFLSQQTLENNFELITNILKQATDKYKLSGFHCLFSNKPKFTNTHINIHTRVGCQFHWFNRDYKNFEHYLEHFSSRKRKTTLKERKKIQDQQIRIERKTGSDISEEDIRFFYYCYQITYLRHHHTGYLNEDFFQQLRQTMSQQTLLVMAFQDNKPVACSWFMFDEHSLYGRYWGALGEFDSLHFECCYYQGIEFCIQQNLQHFDPGTQGEHKISRGFEPVLSHSHHHLVLPEFNQAIGEFVKEEKHYVLEYFEQCRHKLPFKQMDEVKD